MMAVPSLPVGGWMPAPWGPRSVNVGWLPQTAESVVRKSNQPTPRRHPPLRYPIDMSDMDKQRKLALYKSPTYRVRISPSTLLSLSLSSFSSFSPSTSSDDILISKALNMASLRSYGSHSSLPQATSNLPSVAQVAPSAHHSLDGVSGESWSLSVARCTAC